MVYIKSSSIASVLALCATASALPANKINQESGLVDVNAIVQLPKVEVSATFTVFRELIQAKALIAREEKGRFMAHDKEKNVAHSFAATNKKTDGKGKAKVTKGKDEMGKDHGEGKRSWRGRFGRRGPWRNDADADVSADFALRSMLIECVS
ncbi:MAG: hypothetical protein TREMPRED_001254 [Tremellales sp. Tagirdzhanova-0007]|nr:MAG: hypothetical protein TREMPRED_001254 [Tremellales sp. Tagirdzhanova-0007]